MITVSENVRDGAVVPVLSARRVRGTFGSVTVSISGYSAAALHDHNGVAVRVTGA